MQCLLLTSQEKLTYKANHSKAETIYFRVPNIIGVPMRSVWGNFFLKINKTGGDLLNKKSRIRTCRREKHPKKNKISSCLIRNSRVSFFHRTVGWSYYKILTFTNDYLMTTTKAQAVLSLSINYNCYLFSETTISIDANTLISLNFDCCIAIAWKICRSSNICLIVVRLYNGATEGN